MLGRSQDGDREGRLIKRSSRARHTNICGALLGRRCNIPVPGSASGAAFPSLAAPGVIRRLSGGAAVERNGAESCGRHFAGRVGLDAALKTGREAWGAPWSSGELTAGTAGAPDGRPRRGLRRAERRTSPSAKGPVGPQQQARGEIVSRVGRDPLPGPPRCYTWLRGLLGGCELGRGGRALFGIPLAPSPPELGFRARLGGPDGVTGVRRLRRPPRGELGAIAFTLHRLPPPAHEEG
ncbi:hypothetical protein NDU88_003437 [Pleurodeles waltl]|uniref:Uncharacterized protein n=1 Tax=Pleurodeles waltl TaxID=8319 RepID=A0AAV7T5K0_PLEWA|nr:hypothetical protein NDU88_003437 [Pleurodeles waltl]